MGGIREFETRYRVASDVFLRDCAAESLAGGDREYVSWAGELKVRDRIVAQLDALKGIQYAA